MGSDDSDDDKHERVLAPDDLDITKRPEVEEIDDGRYVVSPNGPAKKPDRDLLENPDWLDDEPEADDETSETPTQRHDEQPPSQSTPTEPTQSPADSEQPPNQPSTDQSTPRRQSQPTQSTQSTSTHPDQSTPSQTEPSQQEPTHTEPPAEQRSNQQPNRELAAHDQPPAEPPAAEITNENVSKFLAKSLAQGSGDYGFDATINVEGQVNRGRMTSDDIGETLETLLRWYARQTTDEVDPEVVLGIILAGSDLTVQYPVQSVYAMVKQYGLGPDDSISDLLSAVRQEGTFDVPPSQE